MFVSGVQLDCIKSVDPTEFYGVDLRHGIFEILVPLTGEYHKWRG